MTLSEWRDRLALMSASSICHLEPHEAADLARAIDDAAARKVNRLTATEWRWLGLCTHCAAHLSAIAPPELKPERQHHVNGQSIRGVNDAPGHCGHAPKCINAGEPDERDLLAPLLRPQIAKARREPWPVGVAESQAVPTLEGKLQQAIALEEARRLNDVVISIEPDEALPPRPTPNERGSK